MAEFSKAEMAKLQEIMDDPIKWAQTFLVTYDAQKHKTTQWTARWYQVPMLRDRSLKKVYRCGRRIGKTETMVVEALYETNRRNNFRVLIITPYENQVSLAFMRLNELITESPLIKATVKSATKHPYKIEFNNNSSILGFTTGASSGGGAASIRGQRADLIIMDEVDYMNEPDFDAVMIIAGERRDIRTIMSSTPTGKRSKFYQACTNPDMGFTEHFHPSTHNPGWDDEMEAEFRATLSPQGYVHEVEAEFGVQDTGVFDKSKVDAAKEFYNYAYNPLDYYQQKAIELDPMLKKPKMLLYNRQSKAPRGVFRTMGVDWDKYGASSSLLILDYDPKFNKFMVLKRYQMDKADYSYDHAVNKIIELNEIYQPDWIYCDRGSGEYQIERLRIYGDEHPETGLQYKVKGFSFSEKIEVPDPVSGELNSKPMKPFMVTQLEIAFSRDRLMLSKYDEVLYKQLIDYEVVRIGVNGVPVYTDKNEHFVDALGLAYLAMVMEFKDLTGVISDFKSSTTVLTSDNNPLVKMANMDVAAAQNRFTPEMKEYYDNYDPEDLPGDRQVWVHSDFASNNTYSMGNNYTNSTWSRSGGGFGGGRFGR